MFTRWQIPLLHSNGSKVLPAQNPTPCLPLPRDVSVSLVCKLQSPRKRLWRRSFSGFHKTHCCTPRCRDLGRPDGCVVVLPPPTYEQACLRGWVVSFISFLLLHFFVSRGVASVAGSTVKEETSSCALLRSLPFDFCFYPSGCKMNTACVSAHKCIHTHTHKWKGEFYSSTPCVLQCVADLWSLILYNKWPLGPDRQRSRRGCPVPLALDLYVC